MMKKIVYLIFLIGSIPLLAQQTQITEVPCDFTSGREFEVSSSKVVLKFTGCDNMCNTIKVFNAKNQAQSVQVGDDCKADLSPMLAGITKNKAFKVSINDAIKDFTIKIGETSNGTNPVVTDSESILPTGYRTLEENECLPALKEGPKSKVVEYNVCCNQFYYSYDFKKTFGRFPFGTDQVMVNDQLIFKLANINYREYLTTVTRAYANYNEEVPEQFQRAFDGGGQFQSTGKSKEEFEQLRERLLEEVLDIISELTSYYQGLPQCLEVDTFNTWNRQIKLNINEAIRKACGNCSTNRDAVAILKKYFAKEINAANGKKPASSTSSNTSSSGSSSVSSDGSTNSTTDTTTTPTSGNTSNNTSSGTTSSGGSGNTNSTTGNTSSSNSAGNAKSANTTASGDSEPDQEELKIVGDQIKEFMKLYFGLDKKAYDYQYNIPQVKNYDEITFTINNHPKDSIPGIYLKDEIVSIPIYGGFKIDGSSGPFYSSLTDHVFSTVLDSVSTIAPDGSVSYRSGNRIIRQNSSTGDPGMAGLVHFYSRIGKSLNLSFSLGAGFTFKSTPKPRYLMGGSLLIGRNERISISAGAAFGQVTRLKKEFETPDLYTDVTSITTEQWSKGYFFALTYNIPFRKKSQQVAPAASTTPPPATPSTATADTDEEKDDSETKDEETKDEGNEDDKKEDEQKEGDEKKN